MFNPEEYGKEQLFTLLPELVKEKKVVDIREIFNEYNIVDLTDIFINLEFEEALFIFRILPKDKSAELFTYMPKDYQKRLIEKLTSKEIKSMVDNMFSDDIVEFLEEMPANVIKHILQSISPSQRSEINTLLSYGENSAGYVMSTDFIELTTKDTVETAIKKIKAKANFVETINSCFVIDEKRILVGVVDLRDIIVSKNNKLISDIMDTDMHYVYTDTDQEEVANIISKYDITAMPVLNNENRLIGIITADDVLDILEEEATEDIHKMSGITPTGGSYLNTSVEEMVRSRIYWLLILMISATFTGYILQYFEDKLSAVAVLSASIPIIMSTAGNAGGQSSTMVIRGISIDGLNIKDLFIIVKKELLVGLLCGIVLFIANFIRLQFLATIEVKLATSFVISLTIALSIIFANVSGGILPLIAKSLKLDPASMAAPLITTIVDATSLILYFVLAIGILGH
ncbi:magnesium transporter [Caviibacter abscessus]|uniref:magnesium transporter n=1 Tax=Caviibacter abscessus TaxID=1766719 RepID=UPI00082DB18C|nr:magnesium transporter [Caviibacter abscessus]